MDDQETSNRVNWNKGENIDGEFKEAIKTKRKYQQFNSSMIWKIIFNTQTSSVIVAQINYIILRFIISNKIRQAK